MPETRIRIRVTTPPHSTKQELIMNAFFIPGLVEMWVACGTKFGKAIWIEEDIPTPDGWKKMKDLKKGDYVFDENGKPTKILYATHKKLNHKCYEVVFSDNQKVIADAEHLWITKTNIERKNIARALSPNDRCKSTKAKAQVRTTKEIKKTLLVEVNGNIRPNHSIPLVSQPIMFKEKHLPIDPYLLGVWLGDGGSNGGLITTSDSQIITEIIKLGREVSKLKSLYNWRVLGLTTELKEQNLIKNKHVPNDYLIASPSQRLALLQGLMDTDGTISKKGNCCFDNTNKNLVDAVENLGISLGIKVMRSEKIATLYGVEKKLCYRAYFTTDINVFRLDRKLSRLRKVSSKSFARYITEINEVKSVPVRCIRVENTSHLFLVGKGCIPTHNSFAASTALSLFFPLKKQALLRCIAPIYSQSKICYKYCKRILPPEPHVKANESHLSLYMPSNDSMIQAFHGQHAESLEGEATAANVMDEAAKMSEDVYNSMKTTTTVTRGPILGISTPRGKNNWFYKKCMEAQEEMIRARHENRRPTRIFIHAPTSANPTVSPDVIEDARKSMPARLFSQYFEAQFNSDGGCFNNLNACYITQYQELNDQFLWTLDDIHDQEVVIGVDWARNIDYTVFTAWNPKTRRCCAVWRMRGISYPSQVGRLMTFAAKFKECLSVWHDKTGVGIALDDLLHGTELPFHGITFTNASKNEMMVKLMLSFEQGSIGIPQIDHVVDEFNDIEVRTTLTGLPTYSAPDGSTDDIVMSAGLGHAAMLQHSERDYGIIEF